MLQDVVAQGKKGSNIIFIINNLVVPRIPSYITSGYNLTCTFLDCMSYNGYPRGEVILVGINVFCLIEIDLEGLGGNWKGLFLLPYIMP